MNVSCSVTSASLNGIEAIPVTVEVALTSGLPGISIVGMADTSIQEARERVKAAIKASGFAMPQDKIVVNLAPGDVRKSGSAFDLPIAIGILVATSQVPAQITENRLFVGELSLEGSVRQVNGMLAYGVCADRYGLGLVSGSSVGQPIKNLEQYRMASITRLHQKDCLDEVSCEGDSNDVAREELDFSDIAGHDTAKRALQISAAGNHGVLMVGPPGSGKTMLASRMPTILPKLEDDEKLEAAVVHSVAGEDATSIMARIRPFRKPHHSATAAGLLGGGTPVRPGEVSLAHCGVLFLDELAEFKSNVLQGLRQPIESGQVVITRAQGSIRLPARFLLLAATNPCPCGHLGDRTGQCACTLSSIQRYQNRIGGPLMDRFHIQLDVQKLPPDHVLASGTGTSSRTLLDGISQGRDFTSWRLQREHGDELEAISSKKNLPISQIISECNLDDDTRSFLLSISLANSMSGRTLINTLKVSRTIADLEQSQNVRPEHIAEAAGFRLNETFSAA